MNIEIKITEFSVSAAPYDFMFTFHNKGTHELLFASFLCHKSRGHIGHIVECIDPVTNDTVCVHLWNVYDIYKKDGTLKELEYYTNTR